VNHTEQIPVTVEGEQLLLTGAVVTDTECLAYVSDTAPGFVINMKGQPIGRILSLVRRGTRLRLTVKVAGKYYVGNVVNDQFKGKAV
jgi:hypothetical protein